MLNKKREKIFIVFFVMLIILIVITRIFKSSAKYETATNIKGEIDTAFYIINTDYQTMAISLPEMFPRAQAYIYNFSISNNDGIKRTETLLDYDLKLRMTTNLPLTVELYKYNSDNSRVNIMTNNIVATDEDGTYFRTINTNTERFGFDRDETNIYQLVMYFPEEYNQIEYQDIIEMLEITIDSRQVI